MHYRGKQQQTKHSYNHRPSHGTSCVCKVKTHEQSGKGHERKEVGVIVEVEKQDLNHEYSCARYHPPQWPAALTQRFIEHQTGWKEQYSAELEEIESPFEAQWQVFFLGRQKRRRQLRQHGGYSTTIDNRQHRQQGQNQGTGNIAQDPRWLPLLAEDAKGQKPENSARQPDERAGCSKQASEHGPFLQHEPNSEETAK